MEWVSVKDRLPSTNGLYEVCYASTDLSERCCGREYFLDGKWRVTPMGWKLDIIYWMPLPEPPED